MELVRTALISSIHAHRLSSRSTASTLASRCNQSLQPRPQPPLSVPTPASPKEGAKKEWRTGLALLHSQFNNPQADIKIRTGLMWAVWVDACDGQPCQHPYLILSLSIHCCPLVIKRIMVKYCLKPKQGAGVQDEAAQMKTSIIFLIPKSIFIINRDNNRRNYTN